MGKSGGILYKSHQADLCQKLTPAWRQIVDEVDKSAAVFECEGIPCVEYMTRFFIPLSTD
jgi:hypothetical protein